MIPLPVAGSISFKISITPLLSSSVSLLYYMSSILAFPERSADPPCALSFIIVTYKFFPVWSLMAMAESIG